MSARRSVATHLTAMVYRADGTVARAKAALEWVLEDPAAVRLTYRAPGKVDSRLFARDLLMLGVGSSRAVGDGDVMVRALGAKATCVQLRGGGEPVDVMFETAALVVFLDCCEDICAAGSGDEDERVSAWVGALLLTLGIRSVGKP